MSSIILYGSLRFQKRTKKSNCARPAKVYNHCNHAQSSLAGVMHEGFACTPLFLSVLSISSMHAASGLFSWTMELLAFASNYVLQLSPWTSLVRLVYSQSVQSFLVKAGVAGAGSHPWSEAPSIPQKLLCPWYGLIMVRNGTCGRIGCPTGFADGYPYNATPPSNTTKLGCHTFVWSICILHVGPDPTRPQP